MSPQPARPPTREQQLFVAPAMALRSHCEPISGQDFKDPGQPRYICGPTWPTAPHLAQRQRA
jgi:hypothetical protein